MEVSATADEENFLLAWRFSCAAQLCDVQMANRPLLVEELDNGKQASVETVRRIFQNSGPQVDLSRGLAASIPVFAEVPADQRRYTVSIPLRYDFDGPLPERVRIQLPPVTVGEQSIPLPPLELLKQETGRKIRAYVPADYQALSRTTAFSDFVGASAAVSTTGTFGSFTAPSYLWFERKGEVMLTASFMGRDDPAPPFWKTPFIAGEIKALILSDRKFKLNENSITWQQTTGERPAVKVPVKSGGRNGNLSMYTTRPHDKATLHYPDGTVVDDQLFLALVPKWRPKKARITFPEVVLEGRPLRLKPVEFEYRQGGVGMAVWP